MRESEIVKACLEEIKAVGGAAFKTHGSAHSTVGIPDVVGCYSGCMLLWEVKDVGEHPTKAQEIQMARFKDAGADVAVVRSRAEAIKRLRAVGIVHRPPVEAESRCEALTSMDVLVPCSLRYGHRDEHRFEEMGGSE